MITSKLVRCHKNDSHAFIHAVLSWKIVHDMISDHIMINEQIAQRCDRFNDRPKMKKIGDSAEWHPLPHDNLPGGTHIWE